LRSPFCLRVSLAFGAFVSTGSCNIGKGDNGDSTARGAQPVTSDVGPVTAVSRAAEVIAIGGTGVMLKACTSNSTCAFYTIPSTLISALRVNESRQDDEGGMNKHMSHGPVARYSAKRGKGRYFCDFCKRPGHSTERCWSKAKAHKEAQNAPKPTAKRTTARGRLPVQPRAIHVTVRSIDASTDVSDSDVESLSAAGYYCFIER
jgi:hypothetical protein